MVAGRLFLFISECKYALKESDHKIADKQEIGQGHIHKHHLPSITKGEKKCLLPPLPKWLEESSRHRLGCLQGSYDHRYYITACRIWQAFFILPGTHPRRHGARPSSPQLLRIHVDDSRCESAPGTDRIPRRTLPRVPFRIRSCLVDARCLLPGAAFLSARVLVGESARTPATEPARLRARRQGGLAMSPTIARSALCLDN